MPFKPELHYFYLYIKKHIEERHGIECYHGDNDVLTIPILDKIKKDLERANVIIADCTERNPNVFYELGIAHTLNKKVILITMDDVAEAPTDIRHYEFIKYRLDKHEEFIGRLDNALRNVFIEDYENLYEKAIFILDQFKAEKALRIKPLDKSIFISRIMQIEVSHTIPSLDDEYRLKQFLLPKIIDISEDFKIMEIATKWLLEG
jgi:hypothetical protein